MRVLAASIVALGLILAPVIWYFLPVLLPMEQNFEGPAVDSAARIEIEMLRGQIEDLQIRTEALEREVSLLPRGGSTPRAPADDTEVFRQDGPNTIIGDYADVVLIANRRAVNQGLEVASPSYLEERLGRPREVLSDQCEAMTNVGLKERLIVEQVGPIKVRMLAPAIESLKRVFENIRVTDPDLYARINTAGSLCVRRIRGTANRLSTHSYGLAVDLNIDGHLDTLGDSYTQLGLTILADFFRAEGWVWGAGFGREDSMHFEISRKMLDVWLAEGAL